MSGFDVYVDANRPLIGLYVPAGAGLPDFVDAGIWQFDGTVAEDELAESSASEIRANGFEYQRLPASRSGILASPSHDADVDAMMRAVRSEHRRRRRSRMRSNSKMRSCS